MDQARIDKILTPAKATENKRREGRVRDEFWQTVRRAAGRIPFMDEVVASYFCAMDDKTPARTKGILLAALAYFVVPIDIVPDFLVGLGFTDDIAVLTAAIGAIQAHIKPAHRKAARAFLDNQG